MKKPSLFSPKICASYYLPPTMRLAISVDREEGDTFVANYKRMALNELLSSG